MRAYILSIGSELILGHLTDTNATFLAQELSALGIELLHVVQVGDNRNRLARTIANGIEEANLIICTGGVGPTGDDLTREAISDVVGESPEIDPELLTHLEAFFANRGTVMPERNRKQAWLIPSATTLPNPVGTAPGWFVEHNGKIIVAMPGVPREMFRMWQEQVVPRLLERLPNSIIRSTRIKTIGIGESAAEQELGELVESPNPVIATYAKDDGVHIHVTAMADTEERANELLASGRRSVYEKLGDYIYGENHVSLDQATLDAARRRGVGLSIIDAGGGGRFASLLAANRDAWDVVTTATLLRPDQRSAHELALEAANGPGEMVVVVVVRYSPSELGLVQGTIEVATSGAQSIEQSLSFRGTLNELQRRSGMAAADVVLRALRSEPNEVPSPD